MLKTPLPHVVAYACRRCAVVLGLFWLTACGGGGTGGGGVGATATPAVAGGGPLMVSLATDPSKNGSYEPDVTLTSGYFGGFSKDGKLDLAFVLDGSGKVRRAMVWFHETASVNRYFGCDSVSDCAGVAHAAAAKEITYTSQQLKEVQNFVADNVALTLVAGGQTIQVDGKFTHK